MRRLTPWLGAVAIAIAAVGGVSLVRASADDGGSSGGSDMRPDAGFPGPGDGGFPGQPDGPAGPDGGFPGGMPSGLDGQIVLFGTVSDVGDDSFEVEAPDGDTVTVTVSDDTEITEISDDESTEADLDDLEAGDDVAATGERADDDGDFEATSIRFGDVEGFGDLQPGHGGPPGDMSGQRRSDTDRRDEETDQDSADT